jgi:hypothetical protein
MAEDLYSKECKKSSWLEEALRAARTALNTPDNGTKEAKA